MNLDSFSTGLNPKDIHCFTVEWDILNSKRLETLYTDPIYSHLIQIYSPGLSLWRLGLHSVGDILVCFIKRCPNDKEENNRIRIQFKVCLVNRRNNEIYYQDTSDVLAYSKPSAADSGGSSANESHLKDTIRIPKGLLNIIKNPNVQFHIKLAAVNSEEDNHSTSDYHSLQNDLNRIQSDEDFHDLFLHSGGVDYGLNSSLVEVRLPCFDFLMKTYNLIINDPSNAGERETKCQFVERFESMHKRPVRHIYDDTLAKAMLTMHTRTTRNLVIKQTPERFSLDTLQRSFTPGVCSALVSYLQSGCSEVELKQDVEGLSNIARCLQLTDLVLRLEGPPLLMNVVTEMVTVKSGFGINSSVWRKKLLKPLRKTIVLSEPSQTYWRKMDLTIQNVQPDDVLRCECRFSENERFPILLVYTLTLKSLTGESLKEFEGIHFFVRHLTFRPKTNLKDLDFHQLDFSFMGVFYDSKPPESLRYKDRDNASVWSGGQLSSDLCRRFFHVCEPDVVLEAQGQTMQAHIYILSARSKRFNEELRGKRCLGHETIHQVPGIEYTTLEELVEYLYSGETDLENSNSVQKLCLAGVNFGVPSLVRICQYFLEHKIEVTHMCGEVDN